MQTNTNMCGHYSNTQTHLGTFYLHTTTHTHTQTSTLSCQWSWGWYSALHTVHNNTLPPTPNTGWSILNGAIRRMKRSEGSMREDCRVSINIIYYHSIFNCVMSLAHVLLFRFTALCVWLTYYTSFLFNTGSSFLIWPNTYFPLTRLLRIIL